MTSPKGVHVREWNAAEFAAYLRTRGGTVHRQALLPKGRVSRLRRLLRPVLPRSAELHGCQMVVCGFIAESDGTPLGG
jgi:hypothetical protein